MTAIKLTGNNFNDEVMQSDKPVLVDFYADWCAPCKLIAPVIEELAHEYAGKAKICKLNVDNASNIASQFGVMGIPTIILFSNKQQEVERVVGAVSKQHLVELLDKYTAE